jgi:hypothetical protein
MLSVETHFLISARYVSVPLLHTHSLHLLNLFLSQWAPIFGNAHFLTCFVSNGFVNLSPLSIRLTTACLAQFARSSEQNKVTHSSSRQYVNTWCKYLDIYAQFIVDALLLTSKYVLYDSYVYVDGLIGFCLVVLQPG